MLAQIIQYWIPITSAIISTCGAIFVVVYNNRQSRDLHHDEQTKWVDRLIIVATTSDDQADQTLVLQILSCLRTAKHLKPDSRKYFEQFTDSSIEFCRTHILLEKTNIDSTDAQILRDIANTLLKYHWEGAEYRWYKFCRSRYVEKKCSDIARAVVDEIYNHRVNATLTDKTDKFDKKSLPPQTDERLFTT